MTARDKDHLRRYQRRVEQHYQQSQILDNLFGRAIEAYILINSSGILIDRGKNWTTHDLDDGEPINQNEYSEAESIYLSAMVKMLDENPSRSDKMHFINLVIGLSDLVGYSFGNEARVIIESHNLGSIAKDHHFASTT